MPRRPARPHALRTALLAAAFVAAVLPPGIARGDIFRWVDDQGVVHFTDDPSTIPEGKAGRSKPYLHEGPRKKAPPPQSAPAENPAAAPAPPPVTPSAGRGDEDEALRLEADQLRAKVQAKEGLVRAVDDKRSLTNPLGNRIVDPGDLELYEKYQAELPSDRARLRELEERLR